jgi:4'-phosphopantetheinyl transferase
MSGARGDREHRARLVAWTEAGGVDLGDGPVVLIADALADALPAHLATPAELARARRLRLEASRREYLGARGIIRAFLAPRVGLEPTAIRFAAPDGGKPRLLDRECAGIDVSLSHSGGRVACAFLRAGSIGVDIETLGRRHRGLSAVAARTASPAEREALAAASTPAGAERLFLRAFTRREAVLKAAGLGLWGAAGFDVLGRTAAGVEDISPVGLAGRRWTCESLAAAGDVELAVAYAMD